MAQASSGDARCTCGSAAPRRVRRRRRAIRTRPVMSRRKSWPDGANAPVKADGNFILGPPHNPAPEMTVQEGVPQGTVFNFTMESTDSKIYPGIAREPITCGGRPERRATATRTLVSSHPAPYSSQGGGVCAQAICPRHSRAVHCRGGWTGQGCCSRRSTI